jgi:hypothetical protein
MRDLICVIAVLLVAGWLLGLEFYNSTTSIQLLIAYVAVAVLLSVTFRTKKRGAGQQMQSE